MFGAEPWYVSDLSERCAKMEEYIGQLRGSCVRGDTTYLSMECEVKLLRMSEKKNNEKISAQASEITFLRYQLEESKRQVSLLQSYPK